MAVCIRCKKDYDPSVEGTSKRCQICREIHNAASKKYYEKNKDRIKTMYAEKNAEYWEKNKDKINKKRREAYAADPKRFRDIRKAHREANKKRELANARKRYAKNRDKILEKNRVYRENNREKINLRHNLYRRSCMSGERQAILEHRRLNGLPYQSYDMTYYNKHKKEIEKKKREGRENPRNYDEYRRKALKKFIEENGIDPMAW